MTLEMMRETTGAAAKGQSNWINEEVNHNNCPGPLIQLLYRRHLSGKEEENHNVPPSPAIHSSIHPPTHLSY